MRTVQHPNDDVCLAVESSPGAAADDVHGDEVGRGALLWIAATELTRVDNDRPSAPPLHAQRDEPLWPLHTEALHVPCAWRLRGRLGRVATALLPTALAIAFDFAAQVVQKEDATSPVVIWGTSVHNTMGGQGDMMGRQPWRFVTNSFVSYGMVPMLVNASCTFVFCYVAGLWHGCSPVLASMSANALKSAMYPRTAHVGANERSIAAIVHANLLMKEEPMATASRVVLAALTVGYVLGIAVMGALDNTGDLGLLYSAAIAHGFGTFDVQRTLGNTPRARQVMSAVGVWWAFPFLLLALNAYNDYAFVAPAWMRLDLRSTFQDVPEVPLTAPPSPF
jgi:hypothetical protein